VKSWQWHGQNITYETAGERGSAIVLIHGFGANLGHWRKNIPVLAQQHRVFALDLLGFGGSAKPRGAANYTFEHWGKQVADFITEIVAAPVLLVGNSIGAIVALQTAFYQPLVRGITLINCSLRQLHISKRRGLQGVTAPLLQSLLSIPALGEFFFSQIGQPEALRNILRQAYIHHESITDELIEILLAPSREPGAAQVFLTFIKYDTGPLAEDLLPLVTCPVQILWGAQDPWEPIALGRAYANFPAVREFIPIPGAGHCPQDEVPELINPQLLRWAKACLVAVS